MSIVVTGSAGHLGEAIMRTLRAGNRPAIGVDRKPSEHTDRVGSIADEGFAESCVQRASAVVHAATLHKPHVATHSWQDFLDTNVTGTRVLLEAAAAAGVRSFAFISTTSTYGSALTRDELGPAVWVTENLTPKPKNIYGASKLMAESLCELAHRKHRMPILVLRTSRFFPEEDDAPSVRQEYETANAQANELLYRRVDIEDAAAAVLLALEKAPDIRFSRYIISATTPFRPDDLPLLGEDAARVVACLRAGRDFRSALAREVGSKGYHDRRFAEGPYPV